MLPTSPQLALRLLYPDISAILLSCAGRQPNPERHARSGAVAVHSMSGRPLTATVGHCSLACRMATGRLQWRRVRFHEPLCAPSS